MKQSIRAIEVFKQSGGLLRTAQALKNGIYSNTLAEMKEAGLIEQVSRGLYRLAQTPPLSQPDLVTVALKIPKGVICLISALAYHDISTQVPHEVYVALPSFSRTPRISHPPTRFFRLSKASYTAGIETHTVDGIPIRIYSPEKTVADCFKFRNRVGLDTAIEALKLCRSRKHARMEDLLTCARINRVENIMKPYLESIA